MGFVLVRFFFLLVLRFPQPSRRIKSFLGWQIEIEKSFAVISKTLRYFTSLLDYLPLGPWRWKVSGKESKKEVDPLVHHSGKLWYAFWKPKVFQPHFWIPCPLALKNQCMGEDSKGDQLTLHLPCNTMRTLLPIIMVSYHMHFEIPKFSNLIFKFLGPWHSKT